MVHAQDSSRDDLGERVFDFCTADTISDWAERDVARVCHMGTRLKALNAADPTVRRFILYTDKPRCTEGEEFRRHIREPELLKLKFC